MLSVYRTPCDRSEDVRVSLIVLVRVPTESTCASDRLALAPRAPRSRQRQASLLRPRSGSAIAFRCSAWIVIRQRVGVYLSGKRSMRARSSAGGADCASRRCVSTTASTTLAPRRETRDLCVSQARAASCAHGCVWQGHRQRMLLLYEQVRDTSSSEQTRDARSKTRDPEERLSPTTN